MFKKSVVLAILAAALFFYVRHQRRQPLTIVESPASGEPVAVQSATAVAPVIISNTSTQSSAKNNSSSAKPIEAKQANTFDAYAHFQMGNYEGAVAQLKGALKFRPQDELLRRNLATALLALGFYKLQKKEVSDAESSFDESARLGNPDARKALAALKLRQGQIESARELFEDLSKTGVDPDSLKILIDLALSQDELERADDLLTRMTDMLGKPEVAQQSNISELMVFIDSRKKRLEQKKNYLRAQDVLSRQGIEVSYSSADLRPTADAVARAIESVHARLSLILGPLPAHARLRAWLVPTNDFNSLTGAPPWAAAVFDGYIRIPVGRSSNGRQVSNEILERLAQHETTHAYMYAFCGDVLPSWIGEGLAQIYEGRNVQQSQTDLLRTVGRKALFSVEPELEHPFTEAGSILVSRLYSRSHLLVNAMSREGGGVVATWQRVLSSVCIQRRSLPETLQEQFSVSSVVDLWARYFSQPEP
ncbi:tetratricopeptide repeat protein [bacterium]|nr:tetratricopeptide repeat protein [bacterium]